MNYLQSKWENYQYQDWRLLLFILAITEGAMRRLRLPWRALRPLWFLRGRLTEGKNRRLLRRFIRQWAKDGIMSQDFFYDYEHGRKDRVGQMVVVTAEWKADFHQRNQ